MTLICVRILGTAECLLFPFHWAWQTRPEPLPLHSVSNLRLERKRNMFVLEHALLIDISGGTCIPVFDSILLLITYSWQTNVSDLIRPETGLKFSVCNVIFFKPCLSVLIFVWPVLMLLKICTLSRLIHLAVHFGPVNYLQNIYIDFNNFSAFNFFPLHVVIEWSTVFPQPS